MPAVIYFNFVDLSAAAVTPSTQDEINGYSIENLYNEDQAIYWKSSGVVPKQTIDIDLGAPAWIAGTFVLNHNMVIGDTEFKLFYGNGSFPLTENYNIPLPNNADPVFYKPNSSLIRTINETKLTLSMQRFVGGTCEVGYIGLAKNRYLLEKTYSKIRFNYAPVMSEETNSNTGFDHREIYNIRNTISIDFRKIGHNQLMNFVYIQRFPYVIFFPYGDEPGKEFFYCTFNMGSFDSDFDNQNGVRLYDGSITLEEQIVY